MRIVFGYITNQLQWIHLSILSWNPTFKLQGQGKILPRCQIFKFSVSVTSENQLSLLIEHYKSNQSCVTTYNEFEKQNKFSL